MVLFETKRIDETKTKVLWLSVLVQRKKRFRQYYDALGLRSKPGGEGRLCILDDSM